MVTSFSVLDYITLKQLSTGQVEIFIDIPGGKVYNMCTVKDLLSRSTM